MALQMAADLELRRTPMIGFLLIVEMTDAADKRSMIVLSRPIDCFSLSFERGKYVIAVVFDHVIIDMAALGAALGSRLNIDVRHC
jgi:hypothetical protein